MAKLALDNAEWLSTLSEPLKNDIESIMTQRLPSEGDCLLKEGEIIDRFIIVEAGTLIRTKSTDANGAPLPLDELGAGKVTGFLHVVGHHDDDMVSMETLWCEISNPASLSSHLFVLLVCISISHIYKAFANVIAGKDAKVWIVRGEEFRAITENPQHTTEMMNLLTRLLRKASKIVRATLNETGVRVGRSGEGTGRTIKIMCYDTTSWVREVSTMLTYPFYYAKITLKQHVLLKHELCRTLNLKSRNSTMKEKI